MTSSGRRGRRRGDPAWASTMGSSFYGRLGLNIVALTRNPRYMAHCRALFRWQIKDVRMLLDCTHLALTRTFWPWHSLPHSLFLRSKGTRGCNNWVCRHFCAARFMVTLGHWQGGTRTGLEGGGSALVCKASCSARFWIQMQIQPISILLHLGYLRFETTQLNSHDKTIDMNIFQNKL